MLSLSETAVTTLLLNQAYVTDRIPWSVSCCCPPRRLRPSFTHRSGGEIHQNVSSGWLILHFRCSISSHFRAVHWAWMRNYYFFLKKQKQIHNCSILRSFCFPEKNENKLVGNALGATLVGLTSLRWAFCHNHFKHPTDTYTWGWGSLT